MIDDDENISENDYKIKKNKKNKYFNRDNAHLQRHFETTKAPTAYKSRRGADKLIKEIETDTSKYNMDDIKRIRSIRHAKAPSAGSSGFVLKVEWMQQEG